VKESFPEKNSADQNKPLSSDKPLSLPVPSKEYKGEVAIIIDDFGYNKKIAKEFIDLDIPLDISVLPNLPYSTVIAEMAKKGGKEVMLHLPLEPYGYPKVNPGPGVILVNMEREEILKQLEDNLQSVPYAVGVDNHEGSKATENKGLMTTILERFKEKGLFFVDARTSSKSVAYNVAKQLKMSVGENAVFLDNERSVDYIKQRFRLLIKLAQQKGKAIAIGHPHQETLTSLRESLFLFRKEKIKVTFISRLLQKGN
ncbi:MAG: divergent polysaccharide deacetylase family protein, partial [Candidatus Omnitrophica bacterium]|nr:divergent polysaccharide deacetylase family protein [Candidatus Omnitrophota bacterium]